MRATGEARPPSEKVIAVLGGFGHEGLTTAAYALGYKLISLKLEGVQPATWLKRARLVRDLRETGRLSATIIYLHTTLLLKASAPEYRGAFFEIIREARPLRILLFVFQDNLDGIFSMRHAETRTPMTMEQLTEALNAAIRSSGWGLDRIENAIHRLEDYGCRKKEVDEFILSLYESGAEVAPFFARSDVTIRIQEFLEDLDQGVFLRLFVPSGRLQADQLRGLLSVLERYLREVEGQVFSIDTRRSDQGTAYTFRSTSGIMDLESLNAAFARFDSFMKVCGDDPEGAAGLLQQRGISDETAVFLVERYARDYRRLVLDTRHEFERKTLILRQRFETELLEGNPLPAFSWAGDGASDLLSVAATGANVAVNIGTLSVVGQQNFKAAVEQLFAGNIIYSEVDKELLLLFERYAEPLEALRCRSDLDQLKDDSTPETTRRNAKQRLKSFIRRAATKATEIGEKVAVSAISSYLEAMLKAGS